MLTVGSDGIEGERKRNDSESQNAKDAGRHLEGSKAKCCNAGYDACSGILES